MRRFAFMVVVAVLAAMHVYGQQASSVPREHVRVYANEPGVVPPQLLPLEWPPVTTGKCKDKVDGNVELSLLVDTAGRARNIMFVHPVGNDADIIALRAAGADRFTPGTVSGSPAVVAASLTVKIQFCQIKTKISESRTHYSVGLRSVPVQKLGAPVDPPGEAVLTSGIFDENQPVENSSAKGSADENHAGPDNSASTSPKNRVIPPVVLVSPAAIFTEEARQKKISGSCTISAVIDAQGLPRNMEVVRSLNPGLDENAANALSRYRFKPAIKDWEPVPFKVWVEVNFRLY